jgi:hypothetical protein
MFEADPQVGGNRWNVLKLKAGSSTEAILLSKEFLPLTTHWNMRSVALCPLCSILPARGLFFLPVSCQGRSLILELPALAFTHFESHAKLLHSGLRPGLVWRFARKSLRSPIYSEVVGFQEGVSNFPMLKFASLVMALFHFPPAGHNETVSSYSERLRLSALHRATLEADKLRSVSDVSKVK